MKKIVAVLMALTASALIAGGDIAPVEPITPAVEVQKAGNFYVGLGAMYVYQNEETDKRTALGGTGILGYNINDNVAFEYRGTLTDGPFSRQGLYLKIGAETPVENVYIYALGGYSDTYFRDSGSKDSGEVGVGVEMKDVVANVDVFVDGLYVLRTDRIVPLVGVRYNF